MCVCVQYHTGSNTKSADCVCQPTVSVVKVHSVARSLQAKNKAYTGMKGGGGGGGGGVSNTHTHAHS